MAEFIVPRSRVRAVLTPRAEAAERAHEGDIEGTRRVLDGITGRIFVRGEVRRTLLARAERKAPQTTA